MMTETDRAKETPVVTRSLLLQRTVQLSSDGMFARHLEASVAFSSELETTRVLLHVINCYINMATALLDEWTEEKCLQLIREYRQRPILWDQKDPFFFKKTLKPQAWQEIGDAINISPDQCKHKMIILMSSFRREKAKIMHSLRNISGEIGKLLLTHYLLFRTLQQNINYVN